jgi:hypothetical protein
VPYVGFAFEALSIPSFRKLAIGIPALLLALWTVVGMWKEGGDAKCRRDEGIAPWIPDVGRLLPELLPLGDGDPAAGRVVVRVAMSWPVPSRGRRRGELPRPSAVGARALPAMRSRTASGGLAEPHRRVLLPVTAAARRRGPRAAPRALPAGWRLEIRARPGVEVGRVI